MSKSKGVIFTNEEKVPFSAIGAISNYYVEPSVNSYANVEEVEMLRQEIKVLWECIKTLRKDG